MKPRFLAPADYLRVPWKNGGGVSTTIASEHLAGAAEGDWSGVVWQLGRTQIVAPAPFSDLTGFDRAQTVIGGSGLVLETPTSEIDLRKPFHVVRYDGGTPIVSRLENGPVEVINLIARRDRCSIDLAALGEGSEIALSKARHVIYSPTGQARFSLSGVEHGLAAEHALSINSEAILRGIAGIVVVATISNR